MVGRGRGRASAPQPSGTVSSRPEAKSQQAGGQLCGAGVEPASHRQTGRSRTVLPEDPSSGITASRLLHRRGQAGLGQTPLTNRQAAHESKHSGKMCFKTNQRAGKQFFRLIYLQLFLKVKPSPCPSLVSWISVKVLLIFECAPTILCSLFYIHSILTKVGGTQGKDDVSPPDRGTN